MSQRGFTMLEMLVALAVLALIAAVSYAGLGQAGDGFRMLADYGIQTERSRWLTRQLREDIAYLAYSRDRNEPSIRVESTGGGDAQLWLLVRDMNSPTLMRVRYFVERESHMLMREAVSPWAKDDTAAMGWKLAMVDSFTVQLLDRDGEAQGTREIGKNGLPEAVRVRWSAGGEEHELLLPVTIEAEKRHAPA